MKTLQLVEVEYRTGLKWKSHITGFILFILFLSFVNGDIAPEPKCLKGIKGIKPLSRHYYYERNESEIVELPITIAVTNSISHVISSTIFQIILQEVLGYHDVRLVSFDVPQDLEDYIDEIAAQHRKEIPPAMINVEVWVSPGNAETIEYSKYIGSQKASARFNWYFNRNIGNISLQYDSFKQEEKAVVFRPNLSQKRNLKRLAASNPAKNRCSERKCKDYIYTPPQCVNNKNCGLLIAGYYYESDFLIDEISSSKLFLEIIWIGDQLTVDFISEYSKSSAVLFFERWPSPFAVLENFEALSFPQCLFDNYVLCSYEVHAIHKYIWYQIKSPLIHESLDRFKLTDKDYKFLMEKYNEKRHMKTVEYEVACEWLRNEVTTNLPTILPSEYKMKEVLYIGGIFPMTGMAVSNSYLSIIAQKAVERINKNPNILPNYNLGLLIQNGACSFVEVISHFINYMKKSIKNRKMAGILGPGCSETVQPLVEIADKANYSVISYSAEGAIFNTKYKNFFRTIPENKVYSTVYSDMFNKFNWKNIVSFSESGNKYSEYLTVLKNEHPGLSIINDNYLRQNKDHTQLLKRHKKDNKKIIIADFYEGIAREVLCAAYHEEMTAANGYVYFLPRWLKRDWYNVSNYAGNHDNLPCTTEQLMEVIDGYMSLSYSNFAQHDYKTTENITVGEWKEMFSEYLNSDSSLIDYVGYAYDAVWVYAYALDKLLSENEAYAVNFQHNFTYRRYWDILGNTSFNGVSGHISFGNGTSRRALVEIVQFVYDEHNKNHSFNLVGTYDPDAPEELRLVIDYEKLSWQTHDGSFPNDGTIDEYCALDPLPALLNISCATGTIVLVIIIFATITATVAIISCIYIKRARKLQKEQLIWSKKFNLTDIDNWEIPRDKVVINRNIGKGAFGTVYGGDCYVEKKWTAVAVKTLSTGSTLEEKVEFLAEAQNMRNFDHPNIIKLMGVCTTQEPIFMIMEFMLYGDLKCYLLARRSLVSNKKNREDDEISSKTLTNMASNIASALEYLSNMNFVHRDVACRNCLVTSERCVKLSDFGLTRPTTESNYYRLNRAGLLPIRWMAPESLFESIFTSHSDMWSYGVLLYEIITFGNHPFTSMSDNDVFEHVKNGNSLHPPRDIKPGLRALLLQCWQVNPEKRPSFQDVVNLLHSSPYLITPCLEDPSQSVKSYDHLKISRQTARRQSSPCIKDNEIQLRTISEVDNCHSPLLTNDEPPPLPPMNHVTKNHIIPMNNIESLCDPPNLNSFHF